MSDSALEFINNLKGWVGQRDFTLDRISKVAEYLNRPQDRFRSIHVSGSNGKGSTSKVLSSILKEGGYRVGLYTSPHLFKINERISIDGINISDRKLSSYSEQIREILSQLDIELSQFEVLTLISFLVFGEERVDYAVIEVGLGGRLDATNIISKPDIAIITSISLEHQDILGDSLGQIAREKAGIIKPGAKLIIGDLPQEAKESVRKFYSKCSQVFEYNRDFSSFSKLSDLNDKMHKIEYSEGSNLIEIETSLLGDHQAINLALAVKAAKTLGINNSLIVKGVKEAKWEGRLDYLQLNKVEILIDAAHNVAGIQSAMEFCIKFDFNPDVVVFSALKTKNWKDMINKIGHKIKQWFIIEADSAMTLSSEEITDFISKHDLGEAKTFGKDYCLLANSIKSLPQNTRVLALGSIYMIAKLKPMLVDRSSRE